jgi:predicted peroxiredoxin
MAVCERFAPVVHVTQDCDAASIEADVILFYDIHSSHAITLKGIEKHPALKYEYFNDPHQDDQRLTYRDGERIHKLGPEQRTRRALERGVRFIICPYRNGFAEYIEPHAAGMELLWLPVAPKSRRRVHSLLSDRQQDVLANGHQWPGNDGFHPYEFRRWAYAQPGVTFVDHTLDKGTPAGHAYQAFLSQYAAALALCDTYVVPKYLEIPLAGCLCVCQMLPDYAAMGFNENNCVPVTKENFMDQIEHIKREPDEFQERADAGRNLAEKYTAEHFAESLWAHAAAHVK